MLGEVIYHQAGIIELVINSIVIIMPLYLPTCPEEPAMPNDIDRILRPGPRDGWHQLDGNAFDDVLRFISRGRQTARLNQLIPRHTTRSHPPKLAAMIFPVGAIFQHADLALRTRVGERPARASSAQTCRPLCVDIRRVAVGWASPGISHASTARGIHGQVAPGWPIDLQDANGSAWFL